MTNRERKLATILMSVLLGLGGFLLVKVLYFDRMKKVNLQAGEMEKQIDTRMLEIKKEKDYIAAITKLSPRLEKWQKLSLPEGASAVEAAKGQLSLLKTEYHKYLSKLLDESKIKVRLLDPGKIEAKTVQGTTPSSKKTVYHSIAYEIEGDGALPGVVHFFEKLYSTQLLHQVRKFAITRVSNEKDPNNLFVKMTVEVLQVAGAEKQDPKKRPGLFPVFEKDEKVPTYLASGRIHKDIASKNIFIPPPDKVEVKLPDETPKTTPGEDPDQVFPGVRLTMISYSEYYNSWIAQIHNQGNRDNYTTILIDKALPKGSRYQKERDEAIKEKKTPPSEPVTQWAIKDKYKKTLLDMQIVRIDPLRVIFQADGELFSFDIGSFLHEALEEPLDKAEIKAMGLAGDRDSTLKKVALKELLFKKDRKGYEGHFINPDNKDEKSVLSTEMLPEEFDAPETWVIKDKFGAEMVKLKVLKVEKDRLVFMAEKKHYGIKPGQSLQEAMTKELTADEIKALNLMGP